MTGHVESLILLRPDPSRIIYLRRKHGWTQADLAYRAAVGEKTVRRIEGGHSSAVRERTLLAIARTLAVDVHDLIHYEESDSGEIASCEAV